MIKSLFLDIDGTLISFRTHTVPESAVKALKEAKKNGIKIIICTGRPKQIVCGLGDIEGLVDGYVCTNGAWGQLGTEELWSKAIEPKAVERIVAHVKETGVNCLAVGKKKVAALNKDEEYDRIFLQLLSIENMPQLKSIEEVMSEGILQFTPFYHEEEEREVRQWQLECNIVRWHPSFVDITAQDTDKGKGLRQMAAALGLNIEETMAIGDGGNDLPMIEAAGTGVAMGNSKDTLKEAAQYVTTDIDADGIENALRHYGLI